MQVQIAVLKRMDFFCLRSGISGAKVLLSAPIQSTTNDDYMFDCNILAVGSEGSSFLDCI
jgi:hypothetical protein